MAGRYATALFELALEQNAVDEVRADLDRFDALMAENADLARLVRSPVFSADEQARALAAVLDAAGHRRSCRQVPQVRSQRTGGFSRPGT